MRKDALAKNLLEDLLSPGRVKAAQEGRPVYFVGSDGLIRFGFETKADQPLYVPTMLRESVLFTYHGLPMLGHMGVAKVWPILKRRFHWPKARANLKRWTKSCLCCQRRKPSKPKRQGLSEPMPQAVRPFQSLSFDLVGPFEQREAGNTMILTALCNFTRFAFAIPVPNGKAETVARALVDNIFWNFGPPEKIISDRAQAFIGEVIKGVCKAMDIKHIRSSGYQPQGNAVERFHSFLNAALTIQCHEQRVPWDEALAPI